MVYFSDLASHAIIAGNHDRSPAGAVHPDISGIMQGDGYNLVGNLNGASGTIGTGSDRVDSREHLAPLADNGGPTLTHALRRGSPAIDGGDPSFSYFPYDQRGTGFERVIDGDGDGTAVVDIGAYEVQPSIGGVAFFLEPAAQNGEEMPVVPLLLVVLATDAAALAWLLWRTWRKQQQPANERE
jgi:hypothetical protein